MVGVAGMFACVIAMVSGSWLRVEELGVELAGGKEGSNMTDNEVRGEY